MGKFIEGGINSFNTEVMDMLMYIDGDLNIEISLWLVLAGEAQIS